MYIDALVSTTRLKPVRARNEITAAGYIHDITETLLFILLLKARSEEIGCAASTEYLKVSCAKPLSFKIQTSRYNLPYFTLPIFTTAPIHEQRNLHASSTSLNPPVEAYLPLLPPFNAPFLSTTTAFLGVSHARLLSPARRLRAPFTRYGLPREPLRPPVRLALRCSSGREVQE